MIFDAHSDILFDVVSQRHSLDFHLQELQKYRGAIINYFFKGKESPQNLRDILFFIKKNKDKFPKNLIFGIEGLAPLRKISDFLLVIEAGIKSFSLTWNDANYLGCGTYQNNEYGLTALGIEILNLAYKNDLVLDLSHASEKLFFQALKYYKGRVFVSHANVRLLCDDERNLTEQMLDSLKEKNGLVGVTGIKKFVGLNQDIESMVKHIDYLVKKIGIDSVCLGLDFDNYLLDDEKTNMIDDLQTIHDTPKVLSELARIGYTKEEIEKIAFRNIEKFLKIC